MASQAVLKARSSHFYRDHSFFFNTLTTPSLCCKHIHCTLTKLSSALLAFVLVLRLFAARSGSALKLNFPQRLNQTHRLLNKSALLIKANYRSEALCHTYSNWSIVPTVVDELVFALNSLALFLSVQSLPTIPPCSFPT